jgi:hypothetical protein
MFFTSELPEDMTALINRWRDYAEVVGIRA